MDYLKILAGTGTFLGSYFLAIILQWILPAIIDAINSTEWGFSTTLEGIIWTFTIIVWILGLVAGPIFLYIVGITETEEGESQHAKTFGILIGILWSIFSIMLTYATRNWVTGFAAQIREEYTILLVLFYIGLAIVYIFNIIIIPLYQINRARS